MKCSPLAGQYSVFLLPIQEQGAALCPTLVALGIFLVDLVALGVFWVDPVALGAFQVDPVDPAAGAQAFSPHIWGELDP